MATKLYAQLTDGQLTTTCAAEEDTELIAQIVADGFKLYDDTTPMPEIGEFQATIPAYSEDVDRITLAWKIVEHSPEKVVAEISRLQSELAATDYQVVKSYEYAIAGQAAPYDIGALYTERQAVRNRIDQLEELLVES
jgi:hypothetical protein